MGILSWIIIGLLAGAAAVFLSGDRVRANYVPNITIGIVGATIGGFVANLVSRNPVFAFSLSGLFVAVLGAVVFLAVLTGIRRN
jgi:uncharacterized membrane protein YeaQ/YmgE (transglycosylase-associated protein family)